MNDMGITAVIAPSFSDIFSGNAFKNGILAIVLPQDQVDRLVEVAREGDITVDLENQVVTTPHQERLDRKRVVWGKSVAVRVDLGVGRIIKKKNKRESTKT